jgi:hypothetical protein
MGDGEGTSVKRYIIVAYRIFLCVSGVGIEAVQFTVYTKFSTGCPDTGFPALIYTEVGSAIFWGGALSLECYLFFYVR